MRVRTNLFVLFSFPCLLSLILSSAQPQPDAIISARLLDARLQDRAFKAFVRPITGVPYDAQLPSNLKGMKVSAMRLRSGSLRTRGVHNFKEFEIPSGVIEYPYVKRLVLVYHNLGNWSENFYPLAGYSYLAPVLGLLAYNAENLSASELTELDLRAFEDKPILIKFNDVKSAPLFGSLAKCVYFDLNGSVQFDILLPGNVCSTIKQGHFSIVVESNAPSQVPSDGGGGKNKSKLSIVIPCLVGGVLLLIILGLLIGRVRKAKQGTNIKQLELELEGDGNEILQIASIGDTKAPLAVGTRTRPMIENDYFP